MNCRDFQELIDSYLSDELLTETNHDVLRHMESCVDCRGVIEARRKVRTHLKSAVTNATQYQIGENFTHNLRTLLSHEASKNQKVKSNPWFSFGSMATAAAGLILTFTFGFILISNLGESKVAVRGDKPHLTNEVDSKHIVNVAFGDHQFCAVKRDPKEPVEAASTPAKYKKLKQIALPILQKTIANSILKKSHTCKYKDTEFTHLVVEKDNRVLSVMVTDKSNAENLGEQIARHSSKKYQMARFDVKDSSIFVVSAFDKKVHLQATQALYEPLRRQLAGDKSEFTQSALLMAF